MLFKSDWAFLCNGNQLRRVFCKLMLVFILSTLAWEFLHLLESMKHWSTWVSQVVIISARPLTNLSPTCLKSLHLAVILIRASLEASLYNVNLTVQDAQILGPSQPMKTSWNGTCSKDSDLAPELYCLWIDQFSLFSLQICSLYPWTPSVSM